MLPTIAVILWAYGMYALVRAWSRRKSGQFGSRSRVRRYALLALVGSTGVALAGVLWLSLADDQPDHHLRLAGFLGTVWAEGRPETGTGRVENLQIKGQAPGDQPAYALLHPGVPAAQLEGEKSASPPRRLQKPKVRKGASPAVKVSKAASPASKKENLAAKSRAKKKKPAVTAAAPMATGG